MTNLITALHLACLSLVETGDRDATIGLRGEVSRWQVMPQYYSGSHPENRSEAQIIVVLLWEQRVNNFIRSHRRMPNTQEMALVWRCPAHVDKPSMDERDYAGRFENLMGRKNF